MLKKKLSGLIFRNFLTQLMQQEHIRIYSTICIQLLRENYCHLG